MQYSIDTIGIIHSPYKEKFAIPRQPSLVKASEGELRLISPYNNPETVRGLEQFSHLWLIFIFYQTAQQGWKPTVRPPRLGGNERIGVFATRSTFRPNPIGLSSVELKSVSYENKQVILKLGSLDLVDGTPVIDIKPYIPYSDHHPEAKAGYAQLAPQETLIVTFSELANQQVIQYHNKYPLLRELITQIIEQDPRPAYKKKSSQKQEYGIRLFDFNIRWQVIQNHAIILHLEELTA